MDLLGRLQQWYASQCDGDWEHSWGVSIGTLDNPGWHVRINLEDTELEEVSMPRYEQDNGDEDWVFCWVEDMKFEGAGDPGKLAAILTVFFELVDRQGETSVTGELPDSSMETLGSQEMPSS